MNFKFPGWRFALFVFVLATLHFDFFRGFEFSPIDEHGWLPTILAGKPQPPFISPENGRFLPMMGLEFNLLLPLHATSANSFQLLVFFQLCLFCFVLFKLLESRWMRFLGAFTFLYFIVGFQEAFVRTLVGERGSVILLLIYFGIFLSPKQSSWQKVVMVMAAGLSLYYKETNFILVGVPAFVEFVYKMKHRESGKGPAMLVMAQCLFFLLIYWFFVRSQMHQAYNSEMHKVAGSFGQIGKFLLSDPLIFLLPLVVFREWNWQRYREIAVTIAILVFLLGFIVLGLHSPYYMAPVYSGIVLLYFRYRIKPWIQFTWCSVYVLMCLGDGLGSYAFWRRMPRSMVSVIQKLELNHPHKIMIVDCDDQENNEMIFGFSKFYEYYTGSKPLFILGSSSESSLEGIPRVLTPIHIRNFDFSEVRNGPNYLPSLSLRTIIKAWLVKTNRGYFKNYDIFRNPNFYILNEKPEISGDSFR